MSAPFLRTISKQAFVLGEPEAYRYDIREIAHALSHTCRFGGHTDDFYSVAQHSVVAAEYAWQLSANHLAALTVLLHDASEAYLGDIPSPLKNLPEMAPYLALEARTQTAIDKAFGVHDFAVSDGGAALIKLCDRMALAWEMRSFPFIAELVEPIENELPLKVVDMETARFRFVRTYNRHVHRVTR